MSASLKRPHRALLVRLALLLVVVLVAARDWWLTGAARWLDVGVTPRPADCVLVLPGDSQSRPFVAAALVRRGLARTVLVPRTAVSPDVADAILPPEHEITRRVLALRGVRAEDVHVLKGHSTSTMSDAQALVEYLDIASPASVVVVTSHYHTRRARWIFERALAGRKTDILFVSAPTDFFDASNWWHVKEGLTTYPSEYCKLVYYWVRYPRPQTAIWAAVILAIAWGWRRLKRWSAARARLHGSVAAKVKD